ncbi:MAG: stealth conserved region 3 domain-containing protein [Chloroflexota bacterium]
MRRLALVPLAAVAGKGGHAATRRPGSVSGRSTPAGPDDDTVPATAADLRAAAALAEAGIGDGTIAELAARLDLGATELSAAPRDGYDIPATAVADLLAAVRERARARGLTALVQRAGAIRPLDEALAALHEPGAAGPARGPEAALTHLRVLLVDAAGVARENVLLRTWRRRELGWKARSPLAPVPRIAFDAPRTDALAGLPLDTAVTGDIDAVFTWVDADDPAWRELVSRYRPLDAADADRFAQVDELRYALRSLDLFAPWFRHIFILSNCAPPPWFRPSERVTWVDHREVIPDDVLPLFSSRAIETFLHRIPGLAERFVYFNDDVMLWDSVAPSTFFTAQGRRVVHLEEDSSVAFVLQREAAGHADTWSAAVANGARLLRDHLGFVPTRLHQHAPFALTRSAMEDLEARFPDEMARVRGNRFRATDDVSFVAFVVHHVGLATGEAVEGHVGQVMLRGVNYGNARIMGELAGATFVCINDGRGSGSDPAYQRFKQRFLIEHLPVASSGEDPAVPPSVPDDGSDPAPGAAATTAGAARPRKGSAARRRSRTPEPPSDGPPPIFIVGTSRSGTSLLASMLGAHSSIACGPETALFLHLEGRLKRILDDPRWPDEAVRFLTELQRVTADETVLTHFGLTPERVRRRLEVRPPSARALMEALTVPFMEDQGKRRWAEKTPKHLWHAAMIRRLWPDARVIRIVRDPRGVALSTREWPFQRSAVKVAYQWRLDEAHWRAFSAGDPLTLELRYEDLVTDPEAAVARVCAFLGEPFEPAMVQASAARAKVVAENEAWHAKVAGAVDPARAVAWRTDLPEDEQRAVAMICHAEMPRHGYEGAITPRATVGAHPWIRSLVRAEDVLAELVAQDVVAMPVGEEQHPGSDRRLLLGAPGEVRLADGSPGTPGGWRGVAGWGVRLAADRARRRPALWVPEPIDRAPGTGAADRAGDLLLRALARRVPPDRIGREVGG